MPDPVDFYFDFSSPYAYFAADKIDGLAASFERDCVWHPMMLGVAMKETGNVPLAAQPVKGPYCIHDWERLARYQDLPWTMPDPFPIATLAAARAFYWLWDQDADLAKRFGIECFRSYFGRGEDIQAVEAVAAIAAPLGADADALAAACADDAVKQRVKDETGSALEKGVFGSPFFIIDGEPFWGSDRMWMMKRWMKSGGW